MVKRKIMFSASFKRDYRRMKKRSLDMQPLEELIKNLEDQIPFLVRYKDHPLKGEYKGCRECHISGDWILVYEVLDNEVLLRRTGTHQDVFKSKY